MTDHAALIATLREMAPVLRQMRSDDPRTLPRYRAALRDAADALEAAEYVIEGFLQCAEIADCAPEDMEQETRVLERTARKWRDKYGRGK